MYEKEKERGQLKKHALILFTRIPLPGKTKTRLLPVLDGKACCLLHKGFLADIYQVLSQVKTDHDLLVCYEAEGPLRELKDVLIAADAFFPQKGDDLGEKMFIAIKEVLEKGYQSCLLLGTDVPLLKAEAVDEAFQHLEENDMVVCPTEDGGYYLIGMKEPCKEVFELETYGVECVFEKTQKAAIKAGKICATGQMTRDIDEPEDLDWLRGQLRYTDAKVNLGTRRALEEIFDQEKGESQ